MFKNYLTYSIAQNFHLSCRSLDLPSKEKESLSQSADKMIYHFGRAIYAKDPKEESQFLFVALVCLRDCKEVFDRNRIRNHEVVSQYKVIQSRLVQLCLKASEDENGQMRMLG